MERIILKIVFGSALPIVSTLVFWWGMLLFTDNETVILVSSIIGLASGIAIELTAGLTKRFEVFSMPLKIVIAVFIFYCLGMFGFFMGVPVFHLILGGAAGYYCARRRMEADPSSDQPSERTISIVSAAAMAGICIVSAAFALSSDSTPFDLRNMLHLQFNISIPMLWAIIISGGIALVALQFYITKFVYNKTFSE